jgi:hypothetical protein
MDVAGRTVMGAGPMFTPRQRRRLMIAFAATTIATLCILFGG